MNTRNSLNHRLITALGSAFILTFVPLTAIAEPVEIDASTGVSSVLIDRGETPATFSNELALSASRDTSLGTFYGALYRITPLGDDRAAFDEEVDYTIGLNVQREMVSLDVSANYLTFPGSSEEDSLELAAEIGLDHGLSPGLAVFYDVDVEAFGAEIFAGPSIDMGTWSLGLLARGGFVSSDDGDYSYAGLEATAGHDLTDRLGIEAFARAEEADESTFVAEVENGAVTRTTTDGFGVGVRLTARLR